MTRVLAGALLALWIVVGSPAEAEAHPLLASPSSGAFGVSQQPLLTDVFIPALPVLIVDILPLLGNVVALSSGSGRFGWGIAGLAFGAVGALLMIPSFGNLIMTAALGLLQLVLVALSINNLVLGILERMKKQKDAQSGSRRGGSSIRPAPMRLGGATISHEGWRVTMRF